ncbi:putative FAD-linked sulfhydryl oxidase E10 [BeAn 58058 virus]|uniref:putative FAD-linked sulfhydryl oxidase E10 n=1 Tax=BeAn 58058 virus TaxID=67082 RepID=UPI00090CB17B|nr:putative FAD-linked sulfhydryl oxidase E10 [BeAn 58058 virus]APG58250.1 putative FAD-linked sulfhydryl oxidase E10 [BeAn 58058 virus]
MNPKYWGRAVWTIIFIVLSQCKEIGIEKCKERLYTIIDTLPCPSCRLHAKEAMQKNNIMSSNDINYLYFFFHIFV